MFYRVILSRWEVDSDNYDPKEKPSSLGDFDLSEEQIKSLNNLGYNIYFFPNHPSKPVDKFLEGQDIDVFNYVFVDMDLKDKVYKSKDDFYNKIQEFPLKPTRIVDSGNGVHAYWKVLDLDPMGFLRLQRRLARTLKTDLAVGKLNQLMRVPNTLNTKNKDREKWKLCELIYESDAEYMSENLDQVLEKISMDDEEYCQRSFDVAYNPDKISEAIEDLPRRWFKFATKNSEPYKLFYGSNKDRSKADYRLAHLMLADGFSKEEAMAVLANTSKASERSSSHRYSYAFNIVDKVWSDVEEGDLEKLGYSVAELLDDDDEEGFEGIPFRCHEYYDATVCGYRLGHVLGLVGGAGSGKTAVSLNIFYEFAKKNPEYVHVIFTLEQPMKEIARRWRKITSNNKALFKNVIIVDNYNSDGTYRHLSLHECEDYIKSLQEKGLKVGAVMVDHIGVLRQESRHGEREGLIDICTKMKAFAVNRKVLLLMQSQTSRQKAGQGDIELDKDAAYGTANFEWFVDWLITIWQPLKRIYKQNPNMTVTCFKYCKIRHKHPKDDIKEDTVYALKFDGETERLRRLNLEEKTMYDYWAKCAAAERARDRSKDPAAVSDVDWASSPKGYNGS